MSKQNFLISAVIALIVVMANASLADVPQLISFQGILSDGVGNPLTGMYEITFGIYDAESNGTELWSETDSVECEDGFYTTILGLKNPIDVDFDGDFWLGLLVTGDAEELLPRYRLASVPYAFRAAVAESVAGGGGGFDSDWTGAGTGSMYTTYLTDNVGIGTTNPRTDLEIEGTTGMRVTTGEHSNVYGEFKHGYSDGLIINANAGGGWADIRFQTDKTDRMFIEKGGNVGIGTTSPGTRLNVQMPSGTLSSFSRTGGLLIRNAFFNSGNPLEVQDALGQTKVVVNVGGRVGIGTSDPQTGLHLKGGGLAGHADLRLESNDNESWNIGAGEKLWFAYYDGTYHDYLAIDKTTGEVACPILRITGGSDLAEPFDVVEPDAIEPGMVVVIDPEHPGKLKASDRAYDRCVAGIVSGAGGIKPGIAMVQEDVFEGHHQVALTGRVYGLCDASYGSIEPGDLLTTSSTSGYAMKVSDHERAQGAILGKAMSSLEEGQGLVLVLVTLQ